MRILVVEDETKMAALLKRGLQEENYAVDIASTAENAVWLGSGNAYDAVILDIMSGFRLVGIAAFVEECGAFFGLE